MPAWLTALEHGGTAPFDALLNTPLDESGVKPGVAAACRRLLASGATAGAARHAAVRGQRPRNLLPRSFSPQQENVAIKSTSVRLSMVSKKSTGFGWQIHLILFFRVFWANQGVVFAKNQVIVTVIAMP